MTAVARTLGAMAGRRDDGTRDRPPSSAVTRHGRVRTLGLVAGLLLALGATAAVLSTDDARYLRLALLAACWAFLVAAFLAGGRRADHVAAESREAELRHAYEVELEREVAARAEYELHLEQQLRREAEDGMRRELADLRRELAGLSDLRGDLAALGQLRGELAALGELRADLGRIRSELSEQLSGELLIERLTMRAQAVRLPAERSEDARALDGGTSSGGPAGGAWTQHTTVGHWPDSRDEPPLTRVVTDSAMPAALAPTAPGLGDAPGARRTPPPPIGSTRRLVRVDDEPARGGDDADRAPAAPASPVPGEEPTGPPSWTPSWTSPELPSSPLPSSELPPSGPPSPAPVRPSPTPRSRHRVGLDVAPAAGQAEATAPRRHRRAAEPDGDDRATGGTAPAVPSHPAPGHPAPSAPAARAPEVVAPVPEDRWWDSPAWSGTAEEDRAANDRPPLPAAPQEPAPPAAAAGPGHARLEQILAESGVSPAPGRRRRRHRDDGEPADDVLARVLGIQPPV